MESFDLHLDNQEFTESRIFKAIKRQNHFKVLHAIYNGENVNLRDREFHSTYLHVICSLAESTNEEKYLPMVYQLSNAGIDVNAKDYKGRTALELAIGRELQDIMAALLKCGTDPTEKDYKKLVSDYGSPFEYELINTIEKYEPGLWAAVCNNETGMVHMLINSWCRVNISRNGQTLLEMARETDRAHELINTLDDFEVTIEFVHGTLAGDEKRMLEFLMDSKPCDPNIMDISYQERWSSPLEPRSLRDTAFSMGHMHILHLLPEDQSSGTDLTMSAEDFTQRPVRHIRDKGRTVTVMAITSLNGYTPGSDSLGPLGNIGEDEDEDDSLLGDNEDGYVVIQEMPDEQAQHQGGKSRTASVRRAGSVRQDQYRLRSQKTSTSLTSKASLASIGAVQLSQNPLVVSSPRATSPTNPDTPYISAFGALPIHSPRTAADANVKSLNLQSDFRSPGTIKGAPDEQVPPPVGPKEYYFHEVDGFVEQYYVDGAAPAFKTYVCRPNGSSEDHGYPAGLPKQMRKTDKKSTRSKMCVIS